HAQRAPQVLDLDFNYAQLLIDRFFDKFKNSGSTDRRRALVMIANSSLV
ncbi:hypothetical protein Pse7429DRAFT_3353, partial [Pseudanabaena biceps PCC 7429]